MTSNIKRVQNAQLVILEEFKKICKKHNLRYYAIGGTLIGVHRHKGFIPWDDDIDLGMPRPDFDKLKKIQDEFPNGFSLVCHENFQEWQFNLYQFVDDTSEIIVHLNEKPRHCKLWIDIFPIDGMPGNKYMRWIHSKRIMFYRYLIQIPNLRTQVNVHNNSRGLVERLVLKLLHYIPLSWMVNVDFCLKRMETILRSCEFDKSSYAGNMLGRKREKEAVPRLWWNGPVDYPFENTTISCPHGYHEYLTHIYGDYMKIPPVEKRESHYIDIIRLRSEY